MTKFQGGDFPSGGNSASCALGAFALMLGACLCATPAAAGAASRTHLSDLRTLVADSALSEAAMAKQTATGLRPQQLITPDMSAGPKVQLWDELRIGPLTVPVTGGMTAGGLPPN